MKNLILTFALLIATTFASCTSGSTSSEAVDSTEVVADTVETIDSLVVDTIAADSVM